MKLEAKKLLFDVIKACCEVEAFTAGKAYDDYLASEMLRAAVERKFEVIGEALFRLREKDQETFQQISVSQQAIAFRNRIVHGYDTIDHRLSGRLFRTVWRPSKPRPNNSLATSSEMQQFYVEHSAPWLYVRTANQLS